MAYVDPEKAKARYKRYREKMKALHPAIYKEKVKREHDAAYAKLKADPVKWAKHVTKRSDSAKARWADPEYREERARLQREYLSDPENRRNRTALTNTYVKANKIENRMRFAKFKELGCAVCFEKCDVVLDAHHFDPTRKEFGIGKALGIYTAPDRFVREMAKCTCLCSNCHRKVHAMLIECPAPVFDGTKDPLEG